jgi:alpha-beta hydrolase superfamily lysophospholipase
VSVLIERYRAAGIQNISHDFYPGGRHEMLNEINRDEVRANLFRWISAVVSGKSQPVASNVREKFLIQ